MNADAHSARLRCGHFYAALVWMVLIAGHPAVASADNDFYEQPFGVLFSGEPVTDSNTAATIQTGEPLTSSGSGACGTANRKMLATKWYRFIGNGGVISVDTVGSNFDTVLAAYEGPTPLNDDPLPCSDDAGGAVTSALSFPSVAGRGYLIQVGGCDGCGTTALGSIVLNVSAAQPPTPPPPLPPTPPAPAAPAPPAPPVVIDARATLATDTFVRRSADGRIHYLGLKIRSLVVTRVPAGTRVTVRCTAGDCPRQAKTAGSGRQVTFHMRHGNGKPRAMLAGAKIYITATLPRATGAYIRYRIGRNRLTKVQRCLKPPNPRPFRC
jgi:hypothetical protein